MVFRGEYLTEMMKGLGFIDFAYEKDAVNEKDREAFSSAVRGGEGSVIWG